MIKRRWYIFAGILIVALLAIWFSGRKKEPVIIPKVGGYKIANPAGLPGIDSSFFRQIVDLLASDSLDSKTKDSCAFYIWKAFSNPLDFDKTYADFSTRSMRLLANGALDKEENPYLAEWSNNTDMAYLHTVCSTVFHYYHCMSYGDDTEGVGAALYQIMQTRRIRLSPFRDDENAYQYLDRLNKTTLQEHHKIALVTKGYYDIFVCDKEQAGALKSLMAKMGWVVTEPK